MCAQYALANAGHNSWFYWDWAKESAVVWDLPDCRRRTGLRGILSFACESKQALLKAQLCESCSLTGLPKLTWHFTYLSGNSLNT